MKPARTPHAAVPNYTAQQPSLVPRTPPRTRRAAQSLHSVAFSSGCSSLHAAYLLYCRRRRACRRVEENIRIVDHHFSASSHIRYAATTLVGLSSCRRRARCAVLTAMVVDSSSMTKAQERKPTFGRCHELRVGGLFTLTKSFGTSLTL